MGSIKFQLVQSYPFEVKGKIELPAEEDVCIKLRREFNHGPGSVNLNVQLSFTGDLGGWDYDWTLLNVNHGWPLTDKVFNSCCTSIINDSYSPYPDECNCN